VTIGVVVGLTVHVPPVSSSMTIVVASTTVTRSTILRLRRGAHPTVIPITASVIISHRTAVVLVALVAPLPVISEPRLVIIATVLVALSVVVVVTISRFSGGAARSVMRLLVALISTSLALAVSRNSGGHATFVLGKIATVLWVVEHQLTCSLALVRRIVISLVH